MVTADTFKDFQRSIEADLPFDGHSVFWDGESASLIEDELDSEKTAGNRYSYWNTKLYVSGDKMWSFYYIDLKDDPETIIDDESFVKYLAVIIKNDLLMGSFEDDLRILSNKIIAQYGYSFEFEYL